MAEEEQEVLPPPEGCKPMMIGMKNMEERYGLKTGSGMKDVVPFKLFNKEEVLDEIRKLVSTQTSTTLKRHTILQRRRTFNRCRSRRGLRAKLVYLFD